MSLALKKATDTGSSIRVFALRSKALEFAKSLRKNTTQPQTQAAAVSPAVARAPPARKKNSDSDDVDADMLKQMLRKRMLNRSGNKIIVYWKELSGKDVIIVVIDVCRETNPGEGQGTTRHVSTHISQLPFSSVILETYHIRNTTTIHRIQGLTVLQLVPTAQYQQNFHQHSPVFVSETAGMQGAGGLMTLPLEGKPIDVFLRKTAYDEDNEYRGKTNKQGTWNDKAIMFRLLKNPAFEEVQGQVEQFYKTFKKFILSKGVRALLIDAMYNGMSSHKLVKKLEKDDAEYWKLWKQVEPSYHMMESLDEVISNEGIQVVMQTTLKDELANSSSDLDDSLLRDLYHSETIPLDLESMFRDE